MENKSHTTAERPYAFVQKLKAAFPEQLVTERLRIECADRPNLVTHFRMNVICRANNVIIGNFAFRQDMLRRLRIQPNIIPSERNKRYGREAMEACLRWAEQDLKWPIVYVAVMPENTAARSLFAHFGFKASKIVRYDSEIEKSPNFNYGAKPDKLEGIEYLSLVK